MTTTREVQQVLTVLPLSIDIFHFLLSFLPIEEILRAREVCRVWRRAVEHADYFNLTIERKYHRHFKEHYDKLSLEEKRSINWLEAFKARNVYESQCWGDGDPYNLSVVDLKFLMACKEGNISVINKLLPEFNWEKISDLYFYNLSYHRRSPVYFLWKLGYQDVCDNLYRQICASSSEVQAKPEFQLIVALRTFQKIEVILKIIQDAKLDVNAIIKYNYATYFYLITAIEIGYPEAVEALLNLGAKADRDRVLHIHDEYDPLIDALRVNDFLIINIILQKSTTLTQDYRLAQLAVQTDSCDLVREIEHRSSLFSMPPEREADRPIYHAICQNNLAMVRLLLELRPGAYSIIKSNDFLHNRAYRSYNIEIIWLLANSILNEYMGQDTITVEAMNASLALSDVLNCRQPFTHLESFLSCIKSDEFLNNILWGSLTQYAICHFARIHLENNFPSLKVLDDKIKLQFESEFYKYKFSRICTDEHLQEIALLYAVKHKYNAFATELIQAGVGFKSEYFKHKSLLKLACKYTNYEVGKLILPQIVDKSIFVKVKFLSSRVACADETTEYLAGFGEKFSYFPKRIFQVRMPLLSFVVLFSSLEILQLLIHHGFDVNVYSEQKLTPLHHACHTNKFIFADTLIKAGAIVDAISGYHDYTPLHILASQGYTALINLFITYQANVNARNRFRQTPLHCSFFPGHPNVTKLLIDAGADISLKDEARQTVLHAACLWNNKKSVALILDSKGDVNAQNKDGLTPLHLALDYSYFDLALLLLNYNPDINARSSKGITPLMLSCFKGDIEISRRLILKGAEVNIQDEKGLTPLHYAVMAASDKYKKDIIELLLQNDASTLIKDSDGLTPLDHAPQNSMQKNM